MLIVKNKRYVKKHVVGGAGIFDTITGLFKRLASSNAARSIASDIGKHAINAAKTVGKELATSAISKAKDLAIEKGKQIIDNTPVITQKSKDILTNLINGAGQNDIRIEDLVRKMNGERLRLA